DLDHAAAAQEGLAIRAEGQLARPGVPGEALLSRLGVPHDDRAVRGAGDALAVGAEGHGFYLAEVTAQGADELAGLRIPHLRQRVLAGPHELSAVRAEGRVEHLVQAPESEDLLAGRGVPELETAPVDEPRAAARVHGLRVVTAREEASAVS